MDATFLAIAGIGRLAIDSDMVSPISDEYMLPAAGQGVCGRNKASLLLNALVQLAQAQEQLLG